MQNIVDAEFQNIRPFSKKEVRTTWKELKKRTPNLWYYQIQNQVVYGPKNQIHDLLSAICAKYPMKDVDVLYYNQDYLPQSCFKKKKQYPPIFTSAKKIGDKNVILFADWYYHINDSDSATNELQRDLNSNSWKELIPAVNIAYQQYRWEDRIPKMVWRGSMYGPLYTPDTWTKTPRGHIVYLSQYKHPDWIDAAFSSHSSSRCSNSKYFDRTLTQSRLSPMEQVYYKYQIDIDGLTATFTALSWKLLSGSVVFKQQSTHIMWFHSALEPWKHYIPVDHNLRDVPHKILWAL